MILFPIVQGSQSIYYNKQLAGSALTGHRHKILTHTEYIEDRIAQHKLHRHLDQLKPHRKLLKSSNSAKSISLSKEHVEQVITYEIIQ